MKNLVKIFKTILIFSIISLIILCTKANANTKGTITGNTVNVRSKADTNSKIITTVSKNDDVDVLEKTGEWYKIKYKNNEGYIYKDYIKVEEDDSDEVAANVENEDNEDNKITSNNEQIKYLAAGDGIKIAPNIISNEILTLSNDTEFVIIEQTNLWSYININNTNGWIRNDQIKEKSQQTEKETVKDVEKETTENEKSDDNSETTEKKTSSKTLNKKAYIKYSSVNLRKEPSTDAEVLKKLKLNTEVTIVEEVDSIWYKVNVGDSTGYISQDLLSTEKQKEDTTSRDGNSSSRDSVSTTKIEQENNETKNSTTKDENKKVTSSEINENNTSNTDTVNKSDTKTTTNVTGEEIVAYAKKYLGYSYTYGGSSPKTGFDCSGFTSYVYKNFGYTISRSSVGQASEGTKVEKKDLQPGDIVIFKNNALTKIGHVGIYIGDNKMIHASEPGVGVIITDIDSKAYKYPQRFVMGRRIIK